MKHVLISFLLFTTVIFPARILSGQNSITSHTISDNAQEARSVSAADIDGDGDMDVLAGHNNIAWYENDGFESFTPIPFQLQKLHLSIRLIWTVMGIWTWWGHPPVVLVGMRMMVLGISPTIQSAIIIGIAGSGLSMHWMWIEMDIWMWLQLQARQITKSYGMRMMVHNISTTISSQTVLLRLVRSLQPI